MVKFHQIWSHCLAMRSYKLTFLFSSGVLDQVDQIGIEFHTGQVFLSGTLQTAKKLGELLDALKQLYNIGFKLISNTPNNCVGKSQDQGRQFYTFFDVVLYKA